MVDQDQSAASRDLVRALQREGSLVVSTHPDAKSKNTPAPDYTAATAEAAVKAGTVSVALIIPAGWGQHPIAFRGGNGNNPEIQLLNDQSDAIAPQIVSGLLQKAAMTSMPASMAGEGEKYMKQYIGGLTPEQQKRWDANLAAPQHHRKAPRRATRLRRAARKALRLPSAPESSPFTRAAWWASSRTRT